MAETRRKFRSSADQRIVLHKNNAICPMSDPQRMAATSSHLRNFVVGEAIAMLGVLDSHPLIRKRPAIEKSKAIFQQARGTRMNPFAHVAPCTLLIDSKPMTNYFSTTSAKIAVERIFGMGLKAPDNWKELESFPISPQEHNIADNIAERFSSNDGLAAAFETTANQAVSKGRWDGSGKARLNSSALVDYVETHYQGFWRPLATRAYELALGHLEGQLTATRAEGNDEESAIVDARISVIQTQLDVLKTDTFNAGEVVRNVLAATEKELWQ